MSTTSPSPSNPEKPSNKPSGVSRREFTASMATAAAAAAMGPAIVHADDKSGKKLPVVGSGDFKYECQHNWGELPSHIKWGDTHGVVFDETGLIYITHATNPKLPPMDAIAVFEPSGKFVRSFGKEFHGGGHGLAIRKEGKEEFLYMCDVHNNRTAKITLKGESVWNYGTPQEPGVYKKGGYKPTNIAFHPDGGFYVADGYGSSYVHQYDEYARWVRTWGGKGSAEGKMNCPHGIWWDDRPGRTPSVVVADRANQRLQYFTEDGKHISFTHGLTAPCYFSIRGETLLVPDLFARVSLLDKDNKPIVHLGYDEAWVKHVQGTPGLLRDRPKEWLPGRFVHPHHAAFDKDGNIFVVEWVPLGRVTKLVHVA